MFFCLWKSCPYFTSGFYHDIFFFFANILSSVFSLLMRSALGEFIQMDNFSVRQTEPYDLEISVFISLSLKAQFENEKLQSKNNLNFLQLYRSVCLCMFLCIYIHKGWERRREERVWGYRDRKNLHVTSMKLWHISRMTDHDRLSMGISKPFYFSTKKTGHQNKHS